ncbi:RnfABCDGE type electron transport complex subunit D [Coriobacteriales bacterium OH1046]|nr:RnfABCDGE type electron transport complex subunit D [Coriobacteriales bacterium OH1046]
MAFAPGRPLALAPAPQIVSPETTQSVMRNVLIAMVPAFAASLIFFGLDALVVVGVSVVACVGFEYLWCRLFKLPNTAGDLSAAVTGVLLAFNVPSTIPLYMLIIGDFVAVIVAKALFGGIGRNFANPAIVGRITLAVAFPVAMTDFVAPLVSFSPVDVVSAATALAPTASELSLADMFLGSEMGVLGETSVLAILIGFVFLLVTKTITWHVTATYVGTVFALSTLAGLDPLMQVCSGGLMLGAVFMATDYSTSPATLKGKIIFAVGCGLITCLIRFWGNLNEGVAFSILFMNLLVPYIDQLTPNTPVGAEKRGGGAARE